MKSQAFAFPDVLIRCIPSCVVTRYDIKFFSIGLMSLIIPKFSALSIPLLYHHSWKRSMCSTSAFCCHLLQEASWLSGVSSLHSLPFTPKEGSSCHGDVPHRSTLETMWEKMSLVPASIVNGIHILPLEAPYRQVGKANFVFHRCGLLSILEKIIIS